MRNPKIEIRNPNLAQPEPNGTKLRHRPEHQFLRNTWPPRAAVPMFLLLQVLVNCGLAAVSNASRKFENVAADNKKLKPFCMQFREDEAKLEIRKKSEGRSPKEASSAARSRNSDSLHSLETAPQRPTRPP